MRHDTYFLERTHNNAINKLIVGIFVRTILLSGPIELATI